MKTYKTNDFVVTYKDDQETRDLVFERIIDFMKEQECFSGECFSQSDGPQIAANQLIPEILDGILECEVEYD